MRLRAEQGGVTFPWTSAVVLAPLFSGFLVVSLFCIWEWKGAKLPIVPSKCRKRVLLSSFAQNILVYIFKHVTVTGVYITMFIKYAHIFVVFFIHIQQLTLVALMRSGVIFYSSLFYLPQFFQVALGYSPIRSGVFLFPVLVSQTLASFISVRHSVDRSVRTVVDISRLCADLCAGSDD